MLLIEPWSMIFVKPLIRPLGMLLTKLLIMSIDYVTNHPNDYNCDYAIAYHN